MAADNPNGALSKRLRFFSKLAKIGIDLISPIAMFSSGIFSLKMYLWTKFIVEAYCSAEGVKNLRAVRGIHLSMQNELDNLGSKRRRRALYEVALHDYSSLIRLPIHIPQLQKTHRLGIIGVRRPLTGDQLRQPPALASYMEMCRLVYILDLRRYG